MKNTKTNLQKRQSLLTIITIAVIGLMIIPLTSCPDKADEVVITASKITNEVSLDPKTLSLARCAGSNTAILTAKVTDAYHTTVEWKSTDTSIATVEKVDSENTGTDKERIFTARVTAVSSGRATISVTHENGKSASCEVTVEEVLIEWDTPPGFFDDEDTFAFELEKSEKAILKVNVKNTDNKNIMWLAEDPSIVDVDPMPEPEPGDLNDTGDEGTEVGNEDGEETEAPVINPPDESWKLTAVVTAKKAGTTSISVFTEDGDKEIICSVTVPGVTINLNKTIIPAAEDFYKGKTEQLTATVGNTNIKTVTWDSTAKAVATVDTNGLVTAIKAGTTIISATTTDGNKSAYCTVTVVPPTISLNKTSINDPDNFYIGKTEELTATVGKTMNTDGVTWTSSDTGVATVALKDNNDTLVAIVTAKGRGTTQITAKTKDAGNTQVTAICDITVPDFAITLGADDKATIELLKTETKQLTATVTKTTTNTVTWSPIDGAIAKVDSSGLVTAIGPGTVTIIATTVQTPKKTTYCTIKVPNPDINLDKELINLKVNDEYELQVEVNNSNNSTVNWKSADTSVATVDSSGKVTGNKVGRTTVTVEMSSDSTKNATCDVVVYNVGKGTTMKVEMATLPGGTFMMGSPDPSPVDIMANEGPQHSVTLTGFSISCYEVTQELYTSVMTGIADSIKNDSAFPKPPDTTVRDNLPVENLSWYSALVFCNELSKKDGLTPAYSIKNSTNTADWLVETLVGSENVKVIPTGNNADWNAVTVVSGSTGYRLPTEAQWEYACRAGTTTAYNTGVNTIEDNAAKDSYWYADNSGTKTHNVGEKPANAWGLYDMNGNVWEWCWDWFNNADDDNVYSQTVISQVTDPTGEASGIHRVLRGGAYNSGKGDMRSARRRTGGVPNGKAEYIGFRVVRPVTP